MRTGNRITLRRVILFAWIVLALWIVAPALAQDGGEATPLGEGGAQIEAPAEETPEDLTEVAVELAPLLLGAALIERLLEYIFTLAEASLLRARRVLRGVFEWINGTVVVDAREIYAQYERLREALLKYHTGLIDQSTPKNPDSADPDDWPFEQVMEQFELYGAKIAQLEEWLDTTTSSQAYINRRKNVASVLGIAFGLALAAITEIRLFQPLGFGFAGTSGDVFDIIDLVAAGVLMGLGTDYVHQIISVVTKGQRYLSAASGREAPTTVQIDMSEVKREFGAQLSQADPALDRRFQALESAIGKLGIEVEEPPST